MGVLVVIWGPGGYEPIRLHMKDSLWLDIQTSVERGIVERFRCSRMTVLSS